ncbi:MAG: HD domain-containing protein [Clostridiaceae bacterium]|nr:HD domain-containing protein [Clostridiaceae bacterium]
MADYILTYTKTKFYPLKPRKEDIKIEDIAHSLSLMTRANGHHKHFFSVAQHAVGCSKEAMCRGYSKRVQLGCLLHDASESYISDITRPVKQNIKEYFVIEKKIQNLIYEKYGLGDLSQKEIDQIISVDDALLYYEFETLMDTRLFDVPPKKVMEHDFSQRDFKDVEQEFLSIFNNLVENDSL